MVQMSTVTGLHRHKCSSKPNVWRRWFNNENILPNHRDQ